eukprot:TRINITY_DN9029_c3_g1_i1.p1 TRINITY_DN9029_c3_g1~~TRINITY_DN9029_c3_g1_i1.p1  ORF type:complete len:100 (+),score=5.69 TRINITY_DN9029_c3_g1_i1:661-960(+)
MLLKKQAISFTNSLLGFVMLKIHRHNVMACPLAFKNTFIYLFFLKFQIPTTLKVSNSFWNSQNSDLLGICRSSTQEEDLGIPTRRQLLKNLQIFQTLIP